MLGTEYGHGERHTVLKDLELISVGQRDRCLGYSLSKAGQLPFSCTLPTSGLLAAFTLGLCAALWQHQALAELPCPGKTPTVVSDPAATKGEQRVNYWSWCCLLSAQ